GEALRLDPNYAMAHCNLGAALRATGDVAGAITAYRKALRLDPKLAPSHFNLGLALYDSEDVAGAVAAYRDALHLDPKHAPSALTPTWPTPTPTWAWRCTIARTWPGRSPPTGKPSALTPT